MRSIFISSALMVALAACHRGVSVGSPSSSAARSNTITSASQLFDAMHDRYAQKWYRNVTFVQKSSTIGTDGKPTRVETWYEAGAIPGHLRIDLGDPSRGNGVLYRGDSVYQFQQGKLVDKRVGRNPLLILGFDVYGQPASRTMEQLAAEHIDLGTLHMDTLYRRRVYVVGAGPGDTTTNQFWIDADRLLFVRLIQTDAARKITRDIRFENYVQRGGGWVAETVRMFARGSLVFREDYSNVRVDVPLDSNLFVPEKWSSATHWYKP